jgi:hypothetical protein
MWSARSSMMFWRNIMPLSSESRSKPSKQKPKSKWQQIEVAVDNLVQT